MAPRLLAVINLIPQAVTVAIVTAALKSATRAPDRGAREASAPRESGRSVLAPATT